MPCILVLVGPAPRPPHSRKEPLFAIRLCCATREQRVEHVLVPGLQSMRGSRGQGQLWLPGHSLVGMLMELAPKYGWLGQGQQAACKPNESAHISILLQLVHPFLQGNNWELL